MLGVYYTSHCWNAQSSKRLNHLTLCSLHCCADEFCHVIYNTSFKWKHSIRCVTLRDYIRHEAIYSYWVEFKNPSSDLRFSIADLLCYACFDMHKLLKYDNSEKTRLRIPAEENLNTILLQSNTFISLYNNIAPYYLQTFFFLAFYSKITTTSPSPGCENSTGCIITFNSRIEEVFGAD